MLFLPRVLTAGNHGARRQRDVDQQGRERQRAPLPAGGEHALYGPRSVDVAGLVIYSYLW